MPEKKGARGKVGDQEAVIPFPETAGPVRRAEPQLVERVLTDAVVAQLDGDQVVALVDTILKHEFSLAQREREHRREHQVTLIRALAPPVIAMGMIGAGISFGMHGNAHVANTLIGGAVSVLIGSSLRKEKAKQNDRGTTDAET